MCNMQKKILSIKSYSIQFNLMTSAINVASERKESMSNIKSFLFGKQFRL